jgi:poly-beta-1,6-N-acetyl-D-glucosamine synthase
MWTTWLFWTGIFTVFYAYLGYGMLLWLLLRLKRLFFRKKIHPLTDWPEVTLIVCAYNEADWITQKIANSVAVDYPRERIRFVFVTDGSNDATPRLVQEYPYPAGVQWELHHQPERRGKIAAFQRVMPLVHHDIVVSTDANTNINPEAIRCLVRHFADPQVGAVAGEKRIFMDEKAPAGGAGEGIYWKYESLLKKWDAELWTVVGAAGELFAFRRSLYAPVPADTLVEDFVMTMKIAQKGYRVAYAPDAFATETASASVQEEMKRKVRIAAGGIQAVVRLAPLLNFFRYGALSFQYLSHRVLRWTLAPLFLPVLFFLNLHLAASGSPLYQVLLAGQGVFYLLALGGYLLEQRQLKFKVFFVPYYFCVMNYAMYAGFFRYLRGRQSVVWEKAQRTMVREK